MTFAISIGPNEFAHQALFLIRSIRLQYHDRPVIAFVAESERRKIPDEVLTEIERTATVVHGQLPIPGYDISAKISALVEASRRSEQEPYVLLDTDTLLLDDLTLPDDGADVFLKPVDKAGNGTDRALWNEVYETLDIPFPETRIRSTVDRKRIHPYWNAGVVATRSRSFPERWLSATRTLRAELDHASRFVDQLALGSVSTEFDVHPLTEAYNYPLPHRLTIPSDVRVLHYHSYPHLNRVFDRETREVMATVGVSQRMRSKRPSRVSALYYTLGTLERPLANLIANPFG